MKCIFFLQNIIKFIMKYNKKKNKLKKLVVVAVKADKEELTLKMMKMMFLK